MNKKIKLLLVLLFPFTAFPQQPLTLQLEKLEGITFTQKENPDFKEYYEIMVDQPLDHLNATGTFFKQRIFLGFNDIAAPTVMETEGYALGKLSKPDFIKDCNVISVEHRYFGKSAPEDLNWNYLTIKQEAYDLHHIRELFGKLFKGKWMTTGISKGGQTAVAYKMCFPDDADATIAYVTPIKNSIDDNRISDYMKSVSKTECGKKVFAFQRSSFRNKPELLKEFDGYVKNKGYTFGKLKNETVLDYLLLEYPFAFFQNCFNCTMIPDSTAGAAAIIQELVTVVPPRFYSDAFRPKLEPSFYMFYHELGYYEYDPEPVKQWLADKNYPNNIFAPAAVAINFDPAYLISINRFVNDPATDKIIFIYGELDPYTAAQAVIDKNKKCFKYIVKNGCHKSRVADLSADQKKELFTTLSSWLQWPVGY